jgi:hypothetical protein
MEKEPRTRKPPVDDVEQNRQAFIWGSHYAKLLLKPERWCSTNSAGLRDKLPQRDDEVGKDYVPQTCEALFLVHGYSGGMYILLLLGLLCIVFICGTQWSKNQDGSPVGWTMGLSLAGFCLTYIGFVRTQVRSQ